MLNLSEQQNLQRHSRHQYVIYIVAAVVSILLSTWINLRDTVINPDAICYLLSAQTITEQGVAAGMQFCPQAVWPFYSLLLSIIVRLTHVSYSFAAYFCDGIFTLISVLTFIAIIETLGASKRVLWLAAAVILLSHEFNYVRQYIVRDHGFWAFYLLSLLFMLRFISGRVLATRSIINAFAWSASIGVATLFRIEGAIFMLTLPFVAFFISRFNWSERFKAFFMLNLLTILAGAVVLAWLLIHPEVTMTKLGRVHEIFDQLQGGLQMIVTRYQAMHAAIIQHILTMEAARDASIVLVLTLTSWYLLNIVGNLSWIYSALVVYAWSGRAAKFIGPALVVLIGYLLVNLLITLSFFVEHLFLAKRYLIAFSLTLMIWVPYALDKLIEQSANKRRRMMLYGVVVMILFSSVAGIFDFGYSKVYIRQAGTWLASNVPSKAKLYINDPQLMYYSEHNRKEFYELLKKPLGNVKQYDYLAIRLHHGEVNELSLPSVTEFSNKRGDKVVIYKAERASTSERF